MSLSIYKVSEYETTHEREQYRALKELLIKEYDAKEGPHLLIANPNFDGCELDALFIKRDAVVVLEFKNYGGKIIATENEWLNNDSIIIKGGYNKSPYTQVKQNKWAVINFLKDWLPDCGKIHHVSGTVVFTKDITVDNRLPDKVSSWFKITDMSHIIDVLNDKTSNEINFSENNFRKIVQVMMLDKDEEKLEYDSSKTITDEKPLSMGKKIEPLKTVQSQLEEVKFENFEGVKKLIEQSEFTIENIQKRDGKIASYYTSPMDLSELSNEHIKKKNIKFYIHQAEAITRAKEGKNICITTSTGSGKTLIFQMAALEIISKNPDAKILAIYPMKALGNQQEERWGEFSDKVSRIDGNVALNLRPRILLQNQIIIMTPDVVHAYILSRLRSNIQYEGKTEGDIIKNFLKNIKLIIVDEIHTFIGVFGSNSAYLFRRLNTCIKLLGGKIPQYITASATIASSTTHSKNITGVEYDEIGEELDSSPKSEGNILFLNTSARNIHLQTAQLLRTLVDNIPSSNVITFVDSREKVSHIAAAAAEEIDSLSEVNEDYYLTKDIYAYKAGMEAVHRNAIEQAIQNGTIRGVVSTSALEIGIDIPRLNIAILVGVPNSYTSLHQRLGRVGRGKENNPYLVLIINDRTIRSKAVFRNNYDISKKQMPPTEPALYLDNQQLQLIHALYCVGNNGEFKSCLNNFTPDILNNFTSDFQILCKKILDEQYSDIEQYVDISNNTEGGKNHIAYLLRSFDEQFQLFRVDRRGNRLESRPLDYLGYDQVMREAYPKAIYHGRGNYRVKKVDKGNKTVEVFDENIGNVRLKYTKATPKHIGIYPQVKSKDRFVTKQCGEVRLLNLKMLEDTIIKGYEEYIVFNNGHEHPSQKDEYEYNFSRILPVTGVILFHPVFNDKEVQVNCIALLLYEAFLLDNAFERADINQKVGRATEDFEGINIKDRFIAIYDVTKYGLNITSKLIEESVINNALRRVKEMIENEDYVGMLSEKSLHPKTIDSINVLCKCFEENDLVDVASTYGNLDTVIEEGSVGEYYNEETKDTVRVTVERIQEINGILKYQTTPQINGERRILVSAISPIKGESIIGQYIDGDVINKKLYM